MEWLEVQFFVGRNKDLVY